MTTLDETDPQANMGFQDIPPAPPARAQVDGKRNFSVIWIIPLVALVVGCWLVYKTYSEKGPDVTITFKSSEGIIAGKTLIKHKDVTIGIINDVRLDDDFTSVILKASLVPGVEKYLTPSAKFWVVRPRFSLQGVSGLGTLVSGAYLELEPGKKGGKKKREFRGLDSPPLVRADSQGIRILLTTPTLGSLAVGSPVYYRGIPVGEVLGHDLSPDKRKVHVHAFIKAPYHWMVRENTHFWSVSGIDLSFGADGVRVQTATLASLLIGGVAFETPETLEESKAAVDESVFMLHPDRLTITENAYSQKIPFILYFSGSVRGLKSGAPVEFRGIKIGTVTDIKMEFEREKTNFKVAVLVQIEPERVVEIDEKGELSKMGSPYELLETLVDRGLRAQLETGNYLTGQLYVNLTLKPGTPITLVGGNKRFPELPTVPSNFEEISTFAYNFLAKLQSVPLDEISKELVAILEGANKTVNAPEVLNTIRSLDEALVTLRGAAEKMDGMIEPVSEDLGEAAKAAQVALQRSEELMTLMMEVVGPDAPLNYRVMELSQELTSTSRSIRSFIDSMNRKPESLVFGKGGGKK
ncbi:MAG: MCE family protein [Magnetococcales bacterium]|nr:MCE family protein [Magnetococcales bacterium]